MNPHEIDFVLVSSSARNDSADVRKARNFYEGTLENEGLEIEKETHGCLTFVKIHAPKEVLRKYCEIMQFRMPLRKDPTYRTALLPPEGGILIKVILFLKNVGRYFLRGDLTSEDLAEVKNELKATYSRDKEYLFNEDDPNFFTPTIRILVVHFILNRQTLCPPFADGEPVGLRRLINENLYISAFPLHDGDYQDRDTTRGKLFKKWCELKNWYRSQPLDDVQEYLGTKVAFYFSWLGFYMRLLIPASICGVLVLIYGLLTLSEDRVSQDICNSNLTMCPTCDRTCDYYQLSENCLYSKITYLFDNRFTVVFAFLMAIWASTFLELWKRYDAFLTYRWGLTDHCEDEELPRPEYISRAKRFNAPPEINPVTEKPEPVVPFWKVKLPIKILSYTTILFFMMLVIVAVIAVLVYRMWVATVINAMDHSSFLKANEALFISGTSAALNLISIMVLDLIYTKIAVYLTELEMHRTDTDYETSLTIKTFMFQFLNYYSSIMYIAFFKGKFTGFPGAYWRIFGERQEECDYGGCLLELSIQLAFIMIGKQILSSFFENAAPALQKLFQKNMPKETNTDMYLLREAADLAKASSDSHWIEDFKLLDWESVGLFPEYLKIVIQFGFVTLFVPAFPLAPVFAFINNVFEVRLDARKILTYYRRPIPYQVPGIGVWFHILQFLGSLAVLTNGIVIAFTSNFIPQLIYMMNNAGSDENFLFHSLSVIDVNDLEPTTRPFNSSYSDISTCWYTDSRHPPTSPMKYTPTHLYWQVFIARLIFIILFQNITYAVKSFIDFWIPDQPKELQVLIRKENYRTVNLIIQKESELQTETKINDASNGKKPTDSFYDEGTNYDATSDSEAPVEMLTSSLETGVSKMRTHSSTAAQQQ